MISCERKRGGDFNVDFSEDSSGEGYKLYHRKYLLQGSSARYIYINISIGNWSRCIVYNVHYFYIV